MTTNVIDQVKWKSRALGLTVTLSNKLTINQYVVLNMIGSIPLAQEYERVMPYAAFELLVLADCQVFVKINQVNREVIK